MKVDSISLKTNLVSGFKSKINTENNKKADSFGSLNLMTPCDAKYLINPTKISFKGNHLIKLSPNELEKLKTSVESRVRAFGISNFEIARINWKANFATQAIDKLLNHKIMEYNENIAYEIDNITTKLTVSPNEKADSEALLDFADFIVSDSVKKIIDNSSIKKSLSDILYSVDHYDIDAKKDFINFLLYNPEILAKNTQLGRFIARVNDYTYQDIIDNIDKPYYVSTQKFKIGNYSSIAEQQTTKETNTQINDGKPKGFAQIGGQSKAIETIQNKFIFPKKFPELFQGVQPEKGAILYGPPGTGKSLLAKALSEESDSYFVKIGASDMSQRWVGSSEENWRKLFDDLKANQPAILFVDEADALCKKRGSNDIHGDKELNQFLKLMSDLNLDNTDVFVLMATNKLEAFDEAVLRDGRFGTHIEMLPPQNEKEVEEIFNIHSKNLKLDKNVSENKIEIFKKMLELKLTGSGIEGVLKNSHENALNRLGLFEKMKNNTVTSSDIDNFSIKKEDILTALDKRNVVNKRKVGF
ncbi:MAG: ATP-binding protein [Cyanobacteria bacterium SIG31]|nr:ATP-binding protein [Cyanobacteria bacterium SIG31]